MHAIRREKKETSVFIAFAWDVTWKIVIDWLMD